MLRFHRGFLDHESRRHVGDDPALHAERQGDCRTGGVSRWESNQDWAWKLAEEISHDSASGWIAAWLIALRQLPDDHSSRTGKKPRLFELRHHAVEAIRPLPGFFQ